MAHLLSSEDFVVSRICACTNCNWAKCQQ